MIVPWSYTLLTKLELCPHQAFRMFVLKDLQRVDSEAMKEGRRVHKAFERRIREGLQLPEDLQKFEGFCSAMDPYSPAGETKLGMTSDGAACDFFARGVWGRGTVDVTIMNDATAMIYDWKTGKPREDPFELELHGLLLKAHHPQLQVIRGRYIWLKDPLCNSKDPAHNLSDTIRTMKRVQHLCGIFEDYCAKNNWPKIENPLCGWCDVGDCENNRNANARGQSKAIRPQASS